MVAGFSKRFATETKSGGFGYPSYKQFFSKAAIASARLLRRLVLLLALSVPSMMLWADTDPGSRTDFWGGLGESVWSSTEGWAEDKLGEGRGAARLVATAGELFSVNAEGSDWRAELDERLKDASLDLMRRGVRSGFDGVFGFVTDRFDKNRFRLKSDYRLGLADGEQGWWHTDMMGLLGGIDGGVAGEGLYWQLGARNGGGYGTGEADDDQRTMLNGGLGLRRLVWDGDWLLMGHMFYDRERAVGHSRAGVGVEAKGTHLDVYSNVYHAMSGRVRVGNKWEQARDGREFGVVGRLPSVKWLELSAEHREWDAVLGSPGERSTSYGVKLQPVPLVRFEGSYEDTSDGDSSWQGELVFEYKFGEGISGQPGVRMTDFRDPAERMWEFARRDYGMKKGKAEIETGLEDIRTQDSAASPASTPADRFSYHVEDIRDCKVWCVQTVVVWLDEPSSGGKVPPLKLTFGGGASTSSITAVVRADSDSGYQISGPSVFAGGAKSVLTIERTGSFPTTQREEIFWVKLMQDGVVNTFDGNVFFLRRKQDAYVNEGDVRAGRFYIPLQFGHQPIIPKLTGPDIDRFEVAPIPDLFAFNHLLTLDFKETPDYEIPADQNKDNVYTVYSEHELKNTIYNRKSVGPHESAKQTIYVNVQDKRDEVSFPNKTFGVLENTNPKLTLGKPGDGYEYSFKDDPGGNDHNEYFLIGKDSSTQEATIQFKAPPDYDRPQGVTTFIHNTLRRENLNKYTVTVEARNSQNMGEAVLSTSTVTVMNVQETENSVTISELLGTLQMGGPENQKLSLVVRGGTPGRVVWVALQRNSENPLELNNGRYFFYHVAGDTASTIELRHPSSPTLAKVATTVFYEDGDGNSGRARRVWKNTPAQYPHTITVTVPENEDLALSASDFSAAVGADPDVNDDPYGPDAKLFTLDYEGNLRFKEAPDYEALLAQGITMFSVNVPARPLPNRQTLTVGEVMVAIEDVQELNPVSATLSGYPVLGESSPKLLVDAWGGTPGATVSMDVVNGGDWAFVGNNTFAGGAQPPESARLTLAYTGSLSSLEGSELTVSYDDDDGNAGTLEFKPRVLTLSTGTEDLIGKENDLAINDTPRFLIGLVTISLAGPDGNLFTLNALGDLSFKAALSRTARGKWPDTDEIGMNRPDADHDNKYTVEVIQSAGSIAATYTATISVLDDPKEAVAFVQSGTTHTVDAGALETGYAILAKSGVVGRTISYEVDEMSRAYFRDPVANEKGEVAWEFNGPAVYRNGESNRHTVTVTALDDDPGQFLNKAVLTVTIEVRSSPVTGSVVVNASENQLEVGELDFLPDTAGVDFSISGGADQNKFELDGRTLRFKAGPAGTTGKWPDLESGDEGDADRDGNYVVEIGQVFSDGRQGTVTVTVNLSEDAQEQINFTVNETHKKVEESVETGYIFSATSGLSDRTIRYDISGSRADAFTVQGRKLEFKKIPAYAPASTGGPTLGFRESSSSSTSLPPPHDPYGFNDDPNKYTLTVAAKDDDPGGVQNESMVIVTVEVVASLAPGNLTARATENTLSVSDKQLKLPDKKKLKTLELSGGADKGQFDLFSGNLSFKLPNERVKGKWPDLESGDEGDADRDGRYTVEIRQISQDDRTVVATVTVFLREDPREDLSFVSPYPLDAIVFRADVGAKDTGHIVNAVSGYPTRKITYNLSGRDAGDFELVKLGFGDIRLYFRNPPTYSGIKEENEYMVNVEATDKDDPGNFAPKIARSLNIRVIQGN